MNKKILVISTSPRMDGNTDLLADEFIHGVIDGGNTAERIDLHGRTINFCRGCLACWELHKCVIDDDANKIAEKAFDADVIVFATPIYFYEMSGQMKTLLDRIGSLYTSDYKFRDIYLITASANPDPASMDGAIKGLEGWIKCFEKAKLCGVIKGAGLAEVGAVFGNVTFLKEAYEMGRAV